MGRASPQDWPRYNSGTRTHEKDRAARMTKHVEPSREQKRQARNKRKTKTRAKRKK
jgi:hypothetical protein